MYFFVPDRPEILHKVFDVRNKVYIIPTSGIAQKEIFVSKLLIISQIVF